MPLITHTRYLPVEYCTWITQSRRIYDVMRHACDKVAIAFYSLHKTCSTVKRCNYMLLYVIILHINMVSVIRHIQLSNMGSVPKWSDKWHSTVLHTAFTVRETSGAVGLFVHTQVIIPDVTCHNCRWTFKFPSTTTPLSLLLTHVHSPVSHAHRSMRSWRLTASGM